MNEIERAEPDYIVFVNIGTSWFTYSLKEAIRKPFFDWWYKYENERYDIFGIVDMVSRDDVRYVWGDQASLYSPSSPKNFHIRILKKKCGIKKRDGR